MPISSRRCGLLALGVLLLVEGQAADRMPVCAACHDTGAGGAPRAGRAAEWAPRLKKGMPQLVASVRQGVAGTLMASDTCEGCSTAEIQSLIRRLSAPANPKEESK
ncbi:MAG: c-type cytochrome [Pseudomonadota bacterium]